MKVTVIGAGISGLATAYRLLEAGAEPILVEAEPRVGGKIFSEAADGFLIEHGPNGVLDSRPAFTQLARDLGMGERLMPASDAAHHRYLYLRGQLRALPGGPKDFFLGDILSWRGKARMALEPFIPGRRRGPDESVFDFASRRVGVEAARTLIDPMVTGVFAGDAQRLSLPAAFPRLRKLEDEHGGLVRGMVATMRARRKEQGAKAGGPAGPGGTLTSFPGGLSEMTATLADRLPDVRTGAPVSGLQAREGGGWRVTAAGMDPIDSDAVVFAAPTPVIAQLVGGFAPKAAEALNGIRYSPAAVIAYGVKADQLPRPLDGFGFLVPSFEHRKVLGVLWTSSIFAHRAPAGHAMLRIIVGGARSPELLGLDDASLLAVIKSELEITFGAAMPDPVFSRIIRWPAGIPQYELGHLARREAAERALRPHKGLYLGGNGLYGVSVAECIARGDALVGPVMRGEPG